MSAFETYLSNAEAGQPDAMGMVGQCYLLGSGVEQDLAAGEAWLKKAMEAGSLFAKLRLAEAHFTDGPLERDDMLAWEYAVVVSRAKTDDTALIGWAEHLMARFFIYGLSPARRDLNKALALLQSAKKHHCPFDADDAIATVRKMQNTAYQEFQKGIKHPLSAAGHYEMGLYYKKGDGGYNNYDKEAAASFEKAAKRGHAEAQLELCKAYNEGKGVAKDVKAAENWCKKAIKNGSAAAKRYLSNFDDDILF